MSASTAYETAGHTSRVPWGDALLCAVAAVSWALIGMAGVAALGLHLLDADATASLGPMTAAVVALAAGGSVTPSGDVSAFGLTGAEAATAVTLAPLGVSLVGALLLSWSFLRSLRGRRTVVPLSELLVRAGAVVALFVALMGGLAWAGKDVVTLDGSALGLDDLPGTGGGGGGGGLSIPGLGDLGDLGGLLPDRLGDLVDARASVGFTVDTVPTLLGGLCWSAGVLVVALLASRRTPLPRGWEVVHRAVRPAVSALTAVALLTVVAGLAAAAYAAIGDDHPRRIAGAALLGAPNGTWLGLSLGLLVPWDGRATGPLAVFLPGPLDELLSSERDQSVSLPRLAELDGRVWLLGVAAVLALLLAGVLTAVRTPVAGTVPAGAGAAGAGAAEAGLAGSAAGAGHGIGAVPSGRRGRSADAAARGYVAHPAHGPEEGVRESASRFAGRCAAALGAVTALALPSLSWLTEVSVNASLSVLGFDAFGAGIDLRARLGLALPLGALWGGLAGATGALLARATGTAGRRAAPVAVGAGGDGGTGTHVSGGTRATGAGGRAGVAGPPGAGGPAGAAGPANGSDAADVTGVDDRTRVLRRGGQGPGAGAPGAGGTPSGGGSRGGGTGTGVTGGDTLALGQGAYRAAGPPDGRRPAAPGTGVPGGPGASPAGLGGAGRSGAGDIGAGGVGGGGAAEGAGAAGAGGGDARPGSAGTGSAGTGAPGSPGAGGDVPGGVVPGPYAPSRSYRPPNPDTNPYLRVPDALRERPGEVPEPGQGREPGDAGPPEGEEEPPPPLSPDEVSGAETVVRRIDPPGPSGPLGPPHRPGSGRPGARRPQGPNDGPPPPPPPPPPPGRPKGRG